MGFFKRLIDFFTLGSERPIMRLLAYYIALGAVGFILYQTFPVVHSVVSGSRLAQLTQAPRCSKMA